MNEYPKLCIFEPLWRWTGIQRIPAGFIFLTVQHHGTNNRYYNTTYHCLIDAEFGIYMLYDSINVNIFKIPDRTRAIQMGLVQYPYPQTQVYFL